MVKEAKKSDIADELAAFQKKQQEQNKKVESIQAELAKKKNDMFAELEAKLKKELNQKE